MTFFFLVEPAKLPEHFPKDIHKNCVRGLERKAKKAQALVRSKGREGWQFESLPSFPNPKRRKCGFCKEFPDPVHNSLTCPLRTSRDRSTLRTGRPRRPLMDLVDRKQGKDRIKNLVEYFDSFCLENSENKKDNIYDQQFTDQYSSFSCCIHIIWAQKQFWYNQSVCASPAEGLTGKSCGHY